MQTRAPGQHSYDVEWLFVEIGHNPSNLGTTESALNELGNLWYKGPDWLPNHDQRPEINETTDATQELVTKRILVKQGVEMINNMLVKFT